jgi:class 3 adenylate cyclase
LLRIKDYHDTIQAQAAELAAWNRTLEARVQQQIEELQRLGRLRRFLSPQVVDLIVSSGDEALLNSHRREITVAFCDLRDFTGFAETAEPEEVMGVLREFHAAVGEMVFRYEGTLERFTGDGLMVFFNDPLPCPDPAGRAVGMAVAVRERAAELARTWRKRGYHLDVGVGIAQGYATLGKIGFEGRFDYGAIGTVTNLAARLCAEADGGQILISQRVYAAVEDAVVAERLPDVVVKGFLKPVTAFNVNGLRESLVASSAKSGAAQGDGKAFDDAVRRALAHLSDPPKMTASPLLDLMVVTRGLAARRLDDNRLNRAAVLKDLLLELLEGLRPHEDNGKPTDDACRFYNCLYYPYVNCLYYPYVRGSGRRRAHHVAPASGAPAARGWLSQRPRTGAGLAAAGRRGHLLQVAAPRLEHHCRRPARTGDSSRRHDKQPRLI